MSINKEFTIDLISNASMGFFTNNTMAKFRNQLAQPLQLDGDWQLALASISFPSNINNINSAEIVAYAVLALNLMLHITALDNFEEFAKVYTTVQKSLWKKFFESLN